MIPLGHPDLPVIAPMEVLDLPAGCWPCYAGQDGLHALLPAEPLKPCQALPPVVGELASMVREDLLGNAKPLKGLVRKPYRVLHGGHRKSPRGHHEPRMVVIEREHGLKLRVDVLPVRLPKRHAVLPFPACPAPGLPRLANGLVQVLLNKELVDLVMGDMGLIVLVEMTLDLGWPPTIGPSPELDSPCIEGIEGENGFAPRLLLLYQRGILPLQNAVFPTEIRPLGNANGSPYINVCPPVNQFHPDKGYLILSLHSHHLCIL